MKPSDPKPSSGETPSTKRGFFNLFQRLYRWRWGIFVVVLFGAILMASFLWEKRIEPKLGMHVTGESTDPNDALPPVVDRVSESQTLSAQESASFTTEAQQRLKNFLETVLDQHFQEREKIQREKWKAAIQHHHQWMMLLLLRQDIAEGKPFELIWKKFKHSVESHLEHQSSWKETASILDSFSLKGVWPRWKLLQLLPQFALRAEGHPDTKSGWLSKLEHFLKNLFVFRRTQDPPAAASKNIEMVYKLLKEGALEEALVILNQLRLEPNPGVERWLEQAKAYQHAQMALDNLVQILDSLGQQLKEEK